MLRSGVVMYVTLSCSIYDIRPRSDPLLQPQYDYVHLSGLDDTACMIVSTREVAQAVGRQGLTVDQLLDLLGDLRVLHVVLQGSGVLLGIRQDLAPDEVYQRGHSSGLATMVITHMTGSDMIWATSGSRIACSYVCSSVWDDRSF